MTNSNAYSITSWLPSYLASTWEKVLRAQTSAEKIKAIKQMYSLVVRTMTITLISQYLIQDKDKFQNNYLNDLLLNKLPNMTSDAWLQLFFTSLKAYTGRQDHLFMHELHKLYWDTSQDPPIYILNEENSLKQLGQILTEIELERFAPQSEKEWDNVFKECNELIIEIIGKFSFLQNYELIRAINIGKENTNIEIYRGLEIKQSKLAASDASLNNGWFYWSQIGTYKFLPLHPFLVFWEEIVAEKDIAVYEHYALDKLQYLLTLLGKTIVDNKGIKDFIHLVFETLEEEKRIKEQVEKLEWEQIWEICDNISQHRMSTVRHKYRPELYLQRSHAYELFKNFLVSPKKVFVLVGKSGVGKSNFILSLSDILKDQDNISTIMYDGAQLKVEATIHRIIGDDFNERITISGKKIDDIWLEINKVDGINKMQVVLFVDAINENPKPKELLKQLDSLAQSPWAWLKIVFTCRPETWQVIRRGVKLAESLYYQEQSGDVIGAELQPFSFSEKLEMFSRQELEDVFEKYKAKYELKSDFRRMLSNIKEILRDPLNLWLISNIYQRQEIPNTLLVSNLIKEYLESLISNEILRADDLRFLEKQIIPIMLGANGTITNVLTTEIIDNAGGEDLYEAIFSEQPLSDGTLRNQSFTNLVDTEILTRNKVGYSQQVTFKYERFYEYFAGKYLLDESLKEGDKVGYFHSWANKMELYPFLWGAVKNAILQMLMSDKNEADILVKLSFTEKQNTKELVSATLQEVGQNDITRASIILGQLLSEARKKERWMPFLLPGKRGMYEQRLANMKKVAIEASSKLEVIDVIVEIAGDRSQKTRAHAEKYAYYLWMKDKDKGYEILEKVGEQAMNNWGIPNTRNLDFFVNMVSLIYLQNFATLDLDVLQKIIQRVIRRVFYIDVRPFGLNLRGLDFWMREIILRASIRIVTGVTTQENRYFPPNMRELTFFFEEVLTAKKDLLIRILNYMGDEKPELDVFKKDFIEAAKTEDELVLFLLDIAFLRQEENFKHELIPMLVEVFEWGIQQDMSVVIPQMLFMLYWGYLYKKEDPVARDLLLRLELQNDKAYKGVHKGRRSGQIYGGGSLNWASLAIVDKITDYEDLPLNTYLKNAINSNDTQYVLDIIWVIEELAIVYNHIGPALFLCKSILKIEEPIVQEKLIGFLARARQYHTFAVDGFLLENNCSARFTSKVYSTEASTQENIIFGKAIPFLYHELFKSPTLRLHVLSLFREVLDTSSLRGAIIAFLKKLIVVIYGENIFARQ